MPSIIVEISIYIYIYIPQTFNPFQADTVPAQQASIVQNGMELTREKLNIKPTHIQLGWSKHHSIEFSKIIFKKNKKTSNHHIITPTLTDQSKSKY